MAVAEDYAALDRRAVEAFFAKRLGAPVTIRRMRPTFPGVSRLTFIIDAEVGGESQGFALRVDYPWGGSCPYALRREWETYARLWGSQVPVAEPLWYEHDAEFAHGRPHMVRRLVDGGTMVPGLDAPGAEGDRLRQRIANECAEKLALVHTLDWRALGFDGFMEVPPDPRDALRGHLREWRRLWDAGRQAPFPLIEEALCWLDESLPRDTPRLSLTKGNNGIGEEIWQGEKIVAMSDWELSAICDGVIDLGFSQGTLTMADLRETLRHYEACVGHDVSPERLAGGMFITWFKMVVCGIVYMYDRHIAGRDNRLAMLSFGISFPQANARRLAACIGRDIVEAWTLVATSEQSSYFRVAK